MSLIKNTSVIAKLAFLILLAGYGMFWSWLAGQKTLGLLQYTPAMLVFIIFGVMAVMCVKPLEEFWMTKKTVLSSKHKFYITLISWILVWNSIIVAMALIKSPDVSLYQALNNLMYINIDAQHYFDIASMGYANIEPEHKYFIVFFPVYPLLLRIVFPIIGNYCLTGMILNSVMAFFCAVLMKKIAAVSCDCDAAESNRAVKYLFIFPSAFFFFIPMTESLFLLVSLAFIYVLLQKRYILVFIIGFIAALSRVQGIVLLVPLALELIRTYREEHINGGFNKKRLVNALSILGIPLGFCVYLIINHVVYGNAFQFLIYQKEHWSSQISYFWNTSNYVIDYMQRALTSGDEAFLFGLSIPTILTLIIVLPLMLLGVRRIRLSLTMYSVAYFILSFASTWLLSGPRYMACLFPLAIILAKVTGRSKALDRVVTSAFLALMVLYFHAFIIRYHVY